MPECRVTSHLPIILPQTLPDERRTLLRFSLLSALAHVAALTLLVIWSGGRSGVQPPLQVINVDLDHLEQHQPPPLPRVADKRNRKQAQALPAQAQVHPAAAQKAQAAKSSSLPTPEAPAVAATAGASNATLPGVRSRAVAAAAPVLPGPVMAPASQVAAVPLSAATSIRTVDMAGIRAGYLQRCRMLIERHKEYPLMARKGMIEGTVLIRGTLAPDGVLRQCVIIRGSGSGLLDNAALRAVRSVDQFPPLPSELQGGELVFELPVSFRLSAGQ